jgi:hypothetical protein
MAGSESKIVIPTKEMLEQMGIEIVPTLPYQYQPDQKPQGELEVAGVELISFAQRAAEWGYEKAEAVEKEESLLPLPDRLRVAIQPRALPPTLRASWRNSEGWAERFLLQEKALEAPLELENPSKVHALTKGRATPTLLVTAREFFEESYISLGELGLSFTRFELGTRRWLFDAYKESQVLRSAIYAGIYLTKGSQPPPQTPPLVA